MGEEAEQVDPQVALEDGSDEPKQDNQVDFNNNEEAKSPTEDANNDNEEGEAVENTEVEEEEEEEEKNVAPEDGNEEEAIETEFAEEGKEADGEEEEVKEKEPTKLKMQFPSEKPNGVMPMMISMQNMEKYELKTGSGVKDTVSYKWFQKESVVEEMQTLGLYSDFNDFKKDILAYPLEEILVIADPDEVYGENWMICLTEDAMTTMLAIVQAEEARLAEERRIAEEEEAKRLAAEEAERNIVYEDKPMVPREIVSFTEQETKTEIAWLDVKPTRSFMVLEISRKRSEFGAITKFSDRDAEQSGLFEFRQHKDPNFELKRMQLDVGLQACPSWISTWIPTSAWAHTDHQDEDVSAVGEYPFDAVPATAVTTGKKSMSGGVFDFCAEIMSAADSESAREMPRLVNSSSQTTFFRNVNSSTQYEYIELSEEEKAQLAEEREISSFLESVLPTVEFALQQNETMDVFANEFAQLQSDEVSGLGNKEDNFLRELRTFTDLIFSNGKTLSCVDWHPRLPNVVACACAEPLRFDQRVENSGKERNSFILIWNFADMIHPQLVLQSPHECTIFSFNPDQPHLIAGGCVTGQVVLWDISKAQALLRKKKEDKRAKKENKDINSVESGGEADKSAQNEDAQGKEGSITIPPLEPIVISQIDQSHRRHITHLEWIPNDLHVNSLGRVKANAKDTVERMSHQLVTCAGDGRVMFWDSRYNSQRRAKQTSPEDENGDGAGQGPATDEMAWTPIFKFSLTRNEGSSEFGLSRISLRGRIDAILEAAVRAEELSLTELEAKQRQAIPYVSPTVFSCTTEDGEMLFGDWLGVKGHQKSPRAEASSGEDSARTLDEKILWATTDHFRNSLALERSPFFPFLLLSVSPNGFNIWKEDLDKPLFSSPLVTGISHMTCAAWSPSRPGVIIIGKSDGTLDVWDFVDQSHRPSTTVSVAAYPITSIRFRQDAVVGKHRHKASRQGLVPEALQDERTLRDVLVSQKSARAPHGDTMQLLALGDATGNLHILDIPRNLRWRMPKEEKIMVSFFEREFERVSYVLKRNQAREHDRAGNGPTFEERPERSGQLMDTISMDPNSKAYRKMVEAEEKRYQALSAKLLSEDFGKA